MKTYFSIILVLIVSIYGISFSQNDRWHLEDDGSIKWNVATYDTHMDHIEMSGFYISSIIQYGVKDGVLNTNYHLIFPMLRTIPNDTHASLSYKLEGKNLPKLKADGYNVAEYVKYISHKGFISIVSNTVDGLEITRKLFPAVDKPAFIEIVEIRNPSPKNVVVEIPNISINDTTASSKGVYGSYHISVMSSKNGKFTLRSNGYIDYSIVFYGKIKNTIQPYVSTVYELDKRKEFVEKVFADLQFNSPDKVINRAFEFAKIRATESIYETKGGLMHGPGGGAYYAAIWANDQAEYANPFFAYLGNNAGSESAKNSFRHFFRFINYDYKPIPSSIIAEGTDIWNGAGDRGDMAMIAYGSTRFALTYGDKNYAKELWTLIEWCLDYCKNKVNKDGVVESDCDELENRFPAGNANLHTSCLYYDALISAAYLGRELNIDTMQIHDYLKRADNIKIAIEKYFGANIDGYDTYRYYNGNTTLRAWICSPLTVGIFDRAKGTIEALFSEKLWTKDGLASESGSTTFWDRATLYALRGVFASGETKKAIDYLSYYSKRRLLGEHVPYPVEAYPEGNQRHLSAESALYCRIIVEGMFGLRPEGFNKFSITPQMPNDWKFMELKNVKAFNNKFNIDIKKDKNVLNVKIYSDNKIFLSRKIKNGETIKVELK